MDAVAANKQPALLVNKVPPPSLFPPATTETIVGRAAARLNLQRLLPSAFFNCE